MQALVWEESNSLHRLDIVFSKVLDIGAIIRIKASIVTLPKIARAVNIYSIFMSALE